MTVTAYPTNVPFPSGTTTGMGENGAGTITNIACGGPCTASVFTAAGVLLMSISSATPINMPVNLPFTGGGPTVVQKTPSSVVLTITE